MMARLCWVVVVACVLSACATLTPDPGCVKIGPYGQMCLLSPRALPALDVIHQASVKREGEKHVFIGHLQVNNKALRLASTSLFGVPLFTLGFNGTQVTMTPEIDKLPADVLVALLEVAVASPEALRPRLHGLTLTVSQRGRTQVRQLTEYGHQVATIKRVGETFATSRVIINVPSASLILTLKPLEPGS